MHETVSASTRMLIIAPSWLGDAVMSHSLIRRIARDAPNGIVDVFASKPLEDVYRCMPEVNEVLLNPFKHGELNFLHRIRQGLLIKERSYDVTYVLPNSFKSALVPFFAGIPKRIGYTGEARYGLLNSRKFLDKTNTPLLADRYQQLANSDAAQHDESKFTPVLSVLNEELNATKKLFGLDVEKPYVCLCPGAEFGPAKRWPSQHFAKLAELIGDEHQNIVIIGGPNDINIGNEVQQRADALVVNLVGKTTIKQAIHILAGSSHVVTNDSGLMHVAAALGRRVTALFGSSSPTFTPPLSKSANIMSRSLACSPCYQRECPLGHTQCLIDIHPKDVFEKISQTTNKAN
jgi:heptosyltransferase-2